MPSIRTYKRVQSPLAVDYHMKAREVKSSQRFLSSRQLATSLFSGKNALPPTGVSGWRPMPCPTDMALPRRTSPKSSKDFTKVRSWRSHTSLHKGFRSPGYTALPAEKKLFSTRHLLQLVTLDCCYTGLQKTGAQVLFMENHGFLDKRCFRYMISELRDSHKNWQFKRVRISWLREDIHIGVLVALGYWPSLEDCFCDCPSWSPRCISNKVISPSLPSWLAWRKPLQYQC